MHNEVPAFLVTDVHICGIELPGHLSDAVNTFLRANKMTGPVIDLAGDRQIHLVTTHSKSQRALDALERAGATVHRNSEKLPVRMSTTAWAVDSGQQIPAVVVIAAAVRAVTSGRGPGFARFGEQSCAIA